MTVGQRARLNSPISARQRVERELKVRAGGNEATSPTSPLTVLKRRLVEQTHQIAHLEEQLAAAGNGSLFDLKHDAADDIGRVIADSVSETKARDIAKATFTHGALSAAARTAAFPQVSRRRPSCEPLRPGRQR
jgi:hypothetical protein